MMIKNSERCFLLDCMFFVSEEIPLLANMGVPAKWLLRVQCHERHSNGWGCWLDSLTGRLFISRCFFITLFSSRSLFIHVWWTWPFPLNLCSGLKLSKLFIKSISETLQPNSTFESLESFSVMLLLVHYALLFSNTLPPVSSTLFRTALQCFQENE